MARTTSKAAELEQQPAEEPQDELAQLLEQLGTTGVSVQLYRMHEDGRQAYIGRFEAELFSLELVAERFGGGRYQVRFQGPDGKMLKPGSKVFYIDELANPPKPAPREQPREQAAPEDRLDRLEQLIEQLAARAAAAPAAPSSGKDPFELAAALGTVASSQMANMIALLQPMLEREREPGGGTDATAVLELVREGMKIGRQIAGGGAGGNGDGYNQVVTQFGIPLLEMLKNMQQNQPKDGAPRAALPPGAQPPAQAAAAPVAIEVGAWTPFVVLRDHLPALLDLASKGADPADWAAVIEAEHPGAVDLLIGMVSRKGEQETIDTFFKTFPIARQHEEWFSKLLTELASEPDEEEPSDDDGSEH